MTNQTPESWRARQRRVLRAFSDRAGKTTEQLAVDAGITYWRYVRFESGDTDLPAQHLPALARAYGTTPIELIGALGLLGEEAASWTPRGEMEAAGVDAERIDRVEHTVADWAEADQREVVRRAIEEHEGETRKRHRSAS